MKNGKRGHNACAFFGLAILGTVSMPFSAAAQDRAAETPLKTWSAGIRGTHFYDLPVKRYDSRLSRDLRGLNGENTRVDIGLDAYVEKQFSPLLGIQAGYRRGGMTGSNGDEYYKNSFDAGYADAVFILSNIDKRWRCSRWNIYTRAGLGAGKFSAARYLESDGSANGTDAGTYWESRFGGGLRYRITNYLRVELDAAYNVVYRDGFDGYDASTGSNPYLSTGFGLAYTLGRSRNKPMYGVNFFGEEYFGEAQAFPQPPEDRKSAEDIEDLRRQLAAVQGQLSELEERLENAVQPAPPAISIPEPVAVYFRASSAVLDRESKKAIATALSRQPGAILTLTAYADSSGGDAFNMPLKRRRAESVRSFIKETLQHTGEVKLQLSPEDSYSDTDNFLNRKVLISFE